MQRALTNRLVLMVFTAIATSLGTYLATAFPAVWQAMCVS